MPRETGGHPGGRAGGGVRPQPSEDLQASDKAGAQPEAQGGVHHRAPGDLHPQLQSAQERAEAIEDRVVPG